MQSIPTPKNGKDLRILLCTSLCLQKRIELTIAAGFFAERTRLCRLVKAFEAMRDRKRSHQLLRFSRRGRSSVAGIGDPGPAMWTVAEADINDAGYHILKPPVTRNARSYGRGAGVGRGRGVGLVRVPFGVGVGVTVPVALGVAVGVPVGVAVAVALGAAVGVPVGVAVAVAVAVGVGVGEAAETLTVPVIPNAQCAKQK